MAKNRIYLDWNATAPLLPAAREEMLRVLDMDGNPGSVHKEGRALKTEIEAARRAVASLVGASAAHVTFTGGATEAANLVLTPDFQMGRSALSVSHLYVSAIEHPALREGGRFPKTCVTEIPVLSSGVVDLSALEALLHAHDRSAGIPMVALMLANNETGIVQPVADAAKIVAAHGGLIVVDAVQATGRLPIAMADLGADFLILSSHKIGGPKGAGALVAKGEVLMPKPLIRGGGQEKGYRSGTENAAALAGFAAAALAAAADIDKRSVMMAEMRDRFEAGIRDAAPDVIIHGESSQRLSNTSFFSLPGLKSETGQIAFDIEGIALSAGAACSSGKVGESHVLSAMGFDPKLGALRMSLGSTTTLNEIDTATAIFAKIAGRRKPLGE
jgi:cysteine desulfurase